MYRRTFEVLAKFIAEKTNVTIQFDTDGGAHADMQNKVLHLPKDIANKHAYSAVSLMMHEAGHIKHSTKIPIKEVVKTQSDFFILNAIEDIRVDTKNFGVLPNIREFYEYLQDEVIKEFDKSAPLPARALCGAIMFMEGFGPKGKQIGDDAVNLATNLFDPINRAISHINKNEWQDLRNVIDEIKKILGITAQQDPPIPQPILVQLQIGGDLPGDPNGKTGKGDGSPGNQQCPVSATGKLMKPGTIFAPGQGVGMQGGSGMALGELAMDEICAQQFKEILNMKEIKTVPDGRVLDTDNLISYFTGDVEPLFKEEKVIKKKRSKIAFLLDASGSMNSQVMDGQTKRDIITKSIKKLTNLLNEVSEIEGVNVDWEIGGFTCVYQPFSKENWEKEYYPSGGTCFEGPFKDLMDKMVNDYEIDGKKIIVAMTDGEVYDSEIKNIKEIISRNSADVRALIIGVGSDPKSALCTQIIGDNVIIAEGNATYVIMETVKSML